MTKYLTILALAICACGDPAPMSDVDASIVLPDPVSIATYAPDIWDAIVLVHPTECAPLGIRTLDAETFRAATGACAAGICPADCVACRSHVPEADGSVVNFTGSIHPGTLLYLALAHVYACEGVPFDDGEYQAVRNLTGF